ncbi:MAG: putative pyridoxal-dependent aspartate 1-decarboxylase, partial [Shewanella sp.]
ISAPELCLLTYRYVPAKVHRAMERAIIKGDTPTLARFNELLDGLTQFIQKHQREQGKSFVSRTRIRPARYFGQATVVLRVVLANPLTTHEILNQVLVEQSGIAALETEFLPALLALAD